MRIRLTIAYDGAPFAGWQSQAGGNTVQDVIEARIARIAQTPVRLHGAGRTDAGVHALGQVAHFDAPEGSRMSPLDWQRALNGTLPPSVRIFRASRARPDFHARFDATGKIYRYEIWTGNVLPPLLARRAWHVPQAPGVPALRAAMQVFVGTHDFRAFAANRGKPVDDTVRRIRSIRVAQTGPAIRLTFEGDGFLYKMVRMLTGAGVHVAQGRETSRALGHLLESPLAGKWTRVAPADGLCLMRVRY